MSGDSGTANCWNTSRHAAHYWAAPDGSEQLCDGTGIQDLPEDVPWAIPGGGLNQYEECRHGWLSTLGPCPRCVLGALR